jgi:hypothetical protein
LKSAITIFPKQPASVLYKIAKKASSDLQVSNGNRSNRAQKDKNTLALVIHYICLEEEVDDAISHALKDALSGTDFEQYGRLVIPTVLQQLHSRLAPYDFECTALLNELSTSSIADLRWRDHFIGLGQSNSSDQDVASSLAEWLRDWQSRTPTVPLLKIAIDEYTISKARSIIIPVEIPSVTVVHTADLQLDSKQSGLQNGEVVAMANQPLAATLRIKWTHAWDTKSTAAGPDQDLGFVYDVSGATDQWLIGGKRKGHFSTSSKSASVSFPILMIPIKEGYLSYPNVEIKTAMYKNAKAKENLAVPGSAGIAVGKTRDNQEAMVSCETDYKNVGDVIRVISNSRKTTVSLDASGPQGGAWLLESERRTDDVGSIVG